MNVSLNWLATHLDLSGKSIKEIDDLFTFAGVEVEGIVSKGIASEKIVVAQIMEAVQHPHADRLKVTQVNCGEATLRQIVCGAQNYKVGDKVPCALPGTVLPNGFTIGEAVMRKVESKGMLCSAEEIGLPAGVDGLLILPEDSEIGKPVKQLFDSDTLLELEVTPNRPDLLSHRGMARELATLLKTPLLPLEIPSRETTAAKDIRIDSPEACPLYTAVRISGVTVKESPDWLKQRLESIGLRPINNIVDVTNYVLHELGQPLHAFDAAKLTGSIIVRNAAEGENFLALDDSKHLLTTDDLLISDESGAALALAGVMGGAESGVTETTTDILLESAYFTPQGIRRTSRRTALSSDSSYRFERGVDPAGVVSASAFAVKLILEVAGGTAEAATQLAGEAPVLVRSVTLDAKKLDQLMGGSIALPDAEEILTRLGLTKLADGTWDVPSFRADLQRHIDLVEEIARVHGLDNVPSRFQGTFVPASAVDAAYDADMVLRRRLAALGLHECQTIKLISDAQVSDILPLRPLQDGDVIRVKLPLSEDHAVMRPSIVPGLISSAARNVRQQAKSLRFFEMGRVFRNAGGGKAKDQESETLALLLSGSAQPTGWSQADRTADLYDLKAILSALLGDRRITFAPKERSGFVLASDIKVDDQNIGVFARLTPARERELDFTTPVFVAELDLGKLRKLLNGISHVEDLPQFPGSSRDAAMELPLTTPNSQIEAVIAKIAEPLLISSECFDVFTDATGQKISADSKSVAYRFHYREGTRTLKAEEIDTAHQKVLEALTKGLGVKFR
ncbi:phenylalanine--tRNA ligase subunit beta [Luteolibacter yonseiensis]|uniref:Phenylalanine--tRNA ligase beta subunit n=1 Tax=Luteolibacter yonseiensis TaxID=1144680 RepID=A0A934R261_9BACT|nr:phenylalanine--tRNA ligase subunit beta [Luteolibacter yonseiensis]MBK1814738.1 phenylalanine--tRNA ligase subunit beta [Luteolibacter yonseiensis]